MEADVQAACVRDEEAFAEAEVRGRDALLIRARSSVCRMPYAVCRMPYADVCCSHVC
jgi:hypothetical protein